MCLLVLSVRFDKPEVVELAEIPQNELFLRTSLYMTYFRNGVTYAFNLEASERYGSLNVPFGIFSPIRSTGSYRSGHYVQGLRFSKQAYMGHISGTERPIQLILVSNEKYRCLGVHIGTSGQI